MLFHVLGPLEVHGDDGAARQLGAGKPATLLATLLLQPNAWVAADRLIEATWQEQAVPASTGANLKTYVWQLRRLLPDHLAELQVALGRGPDALATLRAVTADAPLREGAWTQLVRALHTAGMRAGALGAYRRAREVLSAEFGVEPGPALAVHAGHQLAPRYPDGQFFVSLSGSGPAAALDRSRSAVSAWPAGPREEKSTAMAVSSSLEGSSS